MNERPNLVKAEKLSGHLIEGVKPIIVCIGSLAELYEEINSIKPHGGESKNAYHVGYGAPGFSVKGKFFLKTPSVGSIISPIDNFNKFSLGFLGCTGLIVAGIDKETRENISFLSHQNTDDFLYTPKGNFLSDLNQRFSEMKERCVSGTIDAVLVGGHSNPSPSVPVSLKDFNLLSAQVQESLGFEPVIINGPKKNYRTDDVYYDNGHRRLYFVRSEVNPNTGSFVASEKDKK